MKNDSRRAPRVQLDLRLSTRRLPRALFAACALSVLIAAPAPAALVARYTFQNADANDSSASANTYNLTNSAFGTAAPTYLTSPGGNTYVRLAGSENSADGKALVTAANALEANNDDGDDDWIVSLWFRTDDWSQGAQRGFFSTSTDSADDRSWQLFSDDGTGKLSRNDGGGNANNTVDNWSSQPADDTWHHLYLIKRSATDWELYLDKVSVASGSDDAGRVDEIRLGTNRNSNNLLRIDLDFVHVWTDTTDSGSDLTSAFDAGFAHVHIPTPTGLASGMLGLALLATRRRRF